MEVGNARERGGEPVGVHGADDLHARGCIGISSIAPVVWLKNSGSAVPGFMKSGKAVWLSRPAAKDERVQASG
jgi:hypothetical protein